MTAETAPQKFKAPSKTTPFQKSGGGVGKMTLKGEKKPTWGGKHKKNKKKGV